jgi:uncharacterized membrane protein
MTMTFSESETEVKARAILGEQTSDYDTQVKNAINSSIYRIARDAKWRVLRRTTTFNTVASYTEGTGAVSVTDGSTAVTITGATLITDGVHIGRLISIGTGGTPYTIASITGETTLTLDRAYDGDDSTTESYTIYGQEDYVIDIQAGRISMLWHEGYGYPYVMSYVTDLDFYNVNRSRMDANTPLVWRQWGFNGVINQPRQAGVISIASSSSTDTDESVTVYGDVGGYPDQETIVTNSSNGTTTVAGTKSFQNVERVVKHSSTTGRITFTADSGETTIAVINAGDTSRTPEYFRVQIFPYPNAVFPINVLYYKDPYRLVNDYDIHELGHDFDEAIILLATAKLNYGQDKKEGDKFFALYSDEMKSLRRKNIDTIANWHPTLRRVNANPSAQPHPFLSYAQLGGYYGSKVAF